MPKTPCPHCGYENPVGAAYCNLCKAIFVQKPRTLRLQRKIESRRDFYTQIRLNRRNSLLLIAGLFAIVIALGYIMGWLYEIEQELPTPRARMVGVAIAIVVAYGIVLIALFRGPKLVLRIMKAREVTKEEEPVLINVVEEMSIAAGLPPPKVYVVEARSPNALATGWTTSQSAIAVTRGLLQLLSRDELQGVIAHEMSHIRNRDTQYATLIAVIVGGITLFCDEIFRPRRQIVAVSWASIMRGLLYLGLVGVAIIFVVLAPIFSKLVQMAVSRQREFLADVTAVELTRNPGGLADALQKLEEFKSPYGLENRALQHLFIVNPLRSFEMWAGALLSTHPPTEARIRILRSMM
jgi:heat shock protein HtpX